MAGVVSGFMQDVAWLMKNAALRKDVPTFAWATVVTGGSAATIIIDGTTTARQASGNAAGPLRPGDRVRVEIQGTRVVVLANANSATAVQSYTPTWTDGTNSLALGEGGSIIGRYSRLHKWVTLQVILIRGSGAWSGGGTWRFGLPAPARSFMWVSGSGTITGNGKSLPVALYGSDASQVTLLGPGGQISNIYPGSWGQEQIAFQTTYEVA